ncbi:MAG: hypothetical protein ACTS5I_05040 [Rhodanobacter sp.]
MVTLAACSVVRIGSGSGDDTAAFTGSIEGGDLDKFEPTEQTKLIEADVDAMAALIQEGLDYASSQQLREHKVPVNLNHLVQASCWRGIFIKVGTATNGCRRPRRVPQSCAILHSPYGRAPNH